MPSETADDSGGRPRVLLCAYACHPEWSMESRLAWRRAELAAERHDVAVICGPRWPVEELQELAETRGLGGRVEFFPLGHDRVGKAMLASRWLWYSGYGRWQRRLLELARELHAQRRFDLVHQVNYCGYREPGVAWRLGVPFVWGPVGGTQYFPNRFLWHAGPVGGARELGRNLFNYLQLRYSRRVGRAARASTKIIAATKLAQRDLAQRRGVSPEHELETGLDCPIAPRRGPRDPGKPLRVLVAGRLQPWKAAPLLIHAAANLPAGIRYEVRVLGDGPCRDAWRRLAERKGVGDRFEFIAWPSYRETLPHYRWADVLAFTSLRDTSGTGLIESLASGAPILGLDHQGAADIMTAACAIKVPVHNPRQVIADFTAGLVTLANDPDRWLRMSHAAQDRARDFCWGSRVESTNEWYASAMRSAAAAYEPSAVASSPSPRPGLVVNGPGSPTR